MQRWFSDYPIIELGIRDDHEVQAQTWVRFGMFKQQPGQWEADPRRECAHIENDIGHSGGPIVLFES
ncbi:hypothetical protein ACFIOY_20365 [Bradyrhizobium sp. TZ2]